MAWQIDTPMDGRGASQAPQRTPWHRRRDVAAALGVPPCIKRRGRWLVLREVDGADIFKGPVPGDPCRLTYVAMPKEMRTAWRRHQPVVEMLSLHAARAEGR